MLRVMCLVAVSFALFGCSSNHPPLETVNRVDLERYVGLWYEIAAIPQRFQRGCVCTTAEYTLTDKYVKVVNTCRDETPDGRIRTAEGKAFPAQQGDNSKLKVQFFWPFRGDYWIVELGENYEYAAVGAPGRDYLWILSRTPTMDPELYNDIKNRLKARHFPVEQLVMTRQDCLP